MNLENVTPSEREARHKESRGVNGIFHLRERSRIVVLGAGGGAGAGPLNGQGLPSGERNDGYTALFTD